MLTARVPRTMTAPPLNEFDRRRKWWLDYKEMQQAKAVRDLAAIRAAEKLQQPRSPRALAPLSGTVPFGASKFPMPRSSLQAGKVEYHLKEELQMVQQLIRDKWMERFGTLERGFHLVDGDHDGKITKKELRACVIMMNLDPSVYGKALDALLETMQADRNGAFEISEMRRVLKFDASRRPPSKPQSPRDAMPPKSLSRTTTPILTSSASSRSHSRA